MNLIDPIVRTAAEIAAIRKDLHAHPELCFQEKRTADVVAAKLTEWGIPIHRGLGTTGVVGIVKAGSSSRAIGLRADMDALPMQEFNTFAHASVHAGKMHACGHDGHTAMLLAAAHYLAEHRDFDGTVYVIFQPAEEGGGGADTGPLRERGVPVIELVVDTSKYFWYHHTEADTPDKLNPQELNACAYAMAVMAWGVANR